MKTKNITMVVLIALIAASTLFFGCGGNRATTVVVAPDYKKQFAIDAGLALVILDKSPQVIYFGDLKKSLSDADGYNENIAAEILAVNYFSSQLIRDIVRDIDVKEVFKTEIGHRYLITKDAVRTQDENVTIEIPNAGTHFVFNGREAALVLFLDKIRIGTESDPYYRERAQSGIYVTAGRKLVYLANFVLWDNRERKVICYGRVKTAVPIKREEATTANWEEASAELVRTIFEPTGFRKRQGR